MTTQTDHNTNSPTSSNSPLNSVLQGKKVAILATDGFEQAELAEPKAALEAAGATVHIVSDKSDTVQGYQHVEPGDQFKVDLTFDQARSAEYDGVVLPGGVINGDAMRMIDQARTFIKETSAAGKPMAVICHGFWLPISAGLVKGLTMTSWPSLQDDIRNAGGHWVDEAVVVDGNLISSRKPSDLPAFNKAMVQALQTGPRPNPALA